MTNYSMPIVLGTLAAGNQPLSDFDTDFDSVARMGTYMCSASGTNNLTLTALSGYPVLTAYGNIQKIGFIASATSTSLVTIAVSPLGTLNAYLNNGTTQVGAGGQVAGSYYEYAYNSTLNSSAGGWQQISSASGAIKTVVYQSITSTSVYTPTAGMVFAIVEILGGGGGGGGSFGAASSGAGGGGGGAGGYSKAYLSATAIGASVSITVGGAGAAGAAGANNGGTGGSTVFPYTVATITCTGGIGGFGSSGNGAPARGGQQGAGGTASGGTVSTNGAPGFPGTIYGSITALGGTGGCSLYGAGGQATNEGSDGSAATGHGAGGSGGASTTVSKAGGIGTAGLVAITEFCTT